jgi:hypothetical protein
MSRSYTSSPPTASMACSGTALLYLYIYIYIYIYMPHTSFHVNVSYDVINYVTLRSVEINRNEGQCQIFSKNPSQLPVICSPVVCLV